MAEPSRRAAVLGRPIHHSLSPVLHQAAYAELGLNWAFEAIECGVDELPEVLAARTDWGGFACTMPLKRAALTMASTLAPMAEAAGAANTLLPTPSGWRADNTDVLGMMACIATPPATATILGAGGTAQAAVVALSALGTTKCDVLVRDPGRTGELRASAQAVGVHLRIGQLDDAAPALGADLIVSTLPVGAADPLSAHRWRTGQTVLDVVYDPWPTPLAAAVLAAGGTVRSGALLLLHQAAAQVELMTGRIAPFAGMRAALLAARPAAGL